MTIRTGRENLPNGQKHIMGIVNAVTATYGTLHTVLLTGIHR